MGYGGAGEIEHGGGVVDVFNDRVELLARFYGLGVADEERHTHGLFVHPALVLIVVLAEHEALVARVDDHGIVHLPGFLEVFEEVA